MKRGLRGPHPLTHQLFEHYSSQHFTREGTGTGRGGGLEPLLGRSLHMLCTWGGGGGGGGGSCIIMGNALGRFIGFGGGGGGEASPSLD